MPLLDAVLRKRERLLLHIANVEYVASFCSYLRRIRGIRSQQLLACMADVTQSHISRVESGDCNGISYSALCRILDTYKEIANVSRHY